MRKHALCDIDRMIDMRRWRDIRQNDMVVIDNRGWQQMYRTDGTIDSRLNTGLPLAFVDVFCAVSAVKALHT
jgi:hypothetical protein